MNFDRLVSLLGEEFKKSPKHMHLYDLPMFSIYVNSEHKSSFFQNMPYIDDFKKAFADARNTIIKMGFSSMHVNVLFNDLSAEVNQNTGKEGDVGGYAHRKGKSMSINIKGLNHIDYLGKLIVHEWAHLWMYNNSAGFKKAVKHFYRQLVNDVKPHLHSPVAEIPDELRRNVDTQLFTKWIPMVKGLFEQSKVINDLNEYIVAYNHITINDAQYLPRGIIIYGISKKSFDNVNVGDKIYLLKVWDGWVMGNGGNRNYNREVKIPFDQLQSYLEGTPEEIEQKLNQAKIYTSRSDKEKKDYVIQYLKRNIRDTLELSLRDIVGNVARDDLENSSTFIDASVKLLLPKLLKYLKQIIRKPNLGEKVYDKYWADPAHKAGISFTQEMQKIVLKIHNRKESEKINQLSDFSGREYNNLREQVRKLVDWSDAYGMSNDHEIWATGVEDFIKLPPQYKKEIMSLMQKQERRELPNRTMRSKMK